ncbi:MAG: BtpA/SgcQ family protein [Candidatus Heimdallarchaeota archaeon]|nr:BtpA/SgcQ family protein [Candidatus Heimdallarchaeota archaeon]
MLDFKHIPIIGMLHLPRLYPITQSVEEIITYAIEEVQILQDLNYDAVMVENFNDTPFVKSKVQDEVLIQSSLILHELKKEFSIPIGVNLLRNASIQALTLASVLDLGFIRCNIFEGAYVTDQGIIEGIALDLMDKKRVLGTNAQILADIHVKHAYPMGKFSITESAENALLRGGADNIIISGISTGRSPDMNKLTQLNSLQIKPLIGSGLKVDNLVEFKDKISGGIVGSSIKVGGKATNTIDRDLAESFISNWINVIRDSY